jgi:hypothetical protein
VLQSEVKQTPADGSGQNANAPGQSENAGGQAQNLDGGIEKPDKQDQNTDLRDLQVGMEPHKGDIAEMDKRRMVRALVSFNKSGQHDRNPVTTKHENSREPAGQWVCRWRASP